MSVGFSNNMPDECGNIHALGIGPCVPQDILEQAQEII